MDQPLGDHRQHELAFMTGLGGDERVQADLAHRPHDGLHRAMGQRVLHDKQALGGG